MEHVWFGSRESTKFPADVLLSIVGFAQLTLVVRVLMYQRNVIGPMYESRAVQPCALTPMEQHPTRLEMVHRAVVE